MLVAATGALVLSLLHPQPALPLRPCSPQAVSARCGTFVVPENRAEPTGRTIGLNVVVIPAVERPAARDAFTYLAGGPGGAAATEMPASVVAIWKSVHRRHDIVLVDQRGTGASHPLLCPQPEGPLAGDAERKSYVDSCIGALRADPTQYGTRAAVEDLEAVRVALGYRSLDVYGTSYGATVAQMFAKAYPGSVRTLALDGATFTDVPFYARYARNGERALGIVASECAEQPRCRKAFPDWRRRLDTLIAKWNVEPHALGAATVTGDGLAGVVQGMLLRSESAARIPLVVARAAAGDDEPLAAVVRGAGSLPTSLMYWEIMCNEPWVGLDSAGPWGTFLDGVTATMLGQSRSVCAYVPKRSEPPAAWARIRSGVPTLVLAGEADPQDPVGNLPGLRSALPNSRVVVAPGQGHAVGQYGCLGALVGRFVDRGTAKALDTSCARAIKPPAFALR